jgi:hypothetical protein
VWARAHTEWLRLGAADRAARCGFWLAFRLLLTNVVWCTGSVPDFAWIDLPVFAEGGGPVHDRGIVGSEPGLSFVGLVFQSALASSLVGGVGRDAGHIAEHIAARGPGRRPTDDVPAGARRSRSAPSDRR